MIDIDEKWFRQKSTVDVLTSVLDELCTPWLDFMHMLINSNIPTESILFAECFAIFFLNSLLTYFRNLRLHAISKSFPATVYFFEIR